MRPRPESPHPESPRPESSRPEVSAHPELIRRMRRFENTIFDEMTELATRHGAISLGQGFPDDSGPAEVLDAAVAAIGRGDNQYAPGRGLPSLREAIAEHQRSWYGLDLDPDTEVMVSAGATEAMTAAILALVEPGDEVIAFEPTYDCYDGAVTMANGVLRPVRLSAPEYRFDAARLRAAITERTQFLILNSPHNPTGHVFDDQELAELADVVIEHDLFVLTDEVYEHLVFDGHTHTPLSTLPGMADRTLTISSAGKTFSVTGWKIGWLTGPADVITAVGRTKQNMTFTNGTPFQHGVAAGLALPHERIEAIGHTFQERRDLLVAGLTSLGFDVHPAQGTYFVTADIGGVLDDAGRSEWDGMEFCRRLPELVGVGAIPAQVFYADPDDPADPRVRHLVRFTCSKSARTITTGLERLAGLRDAIRRSTT